MSFMELPVLLVILFILIFLAVLGVRALKRPRVTGYEGMVGESGIVRKSKGFRGRPVIEIRGELWWCRSNVPLSPGMEVRVVSHESGSTLLVVEPVDLKGV